MFLVGAARDDLGASSGGGLQRFGRGSDFSSAFRLRFHPQFDQPADGFFARAPEKPNPAGMG
jgi:hypothetical protein